MPLVAAKSLPAFQSGEWSGFAWEHSNPRSYRLHRIFMPPVGRHHCNLSYLHKWRHLKAYSLHRPLIVSSIQVHSDEDKSETTPSSSSMHHSVSGDACSSINVEHSDGNDSNDLLLSNEHNPVSSESAYEKQDRRTECKELPSNMDVDDLMCVIKNAEKDIALLDEARMRAVEILKRIHAEKGSSLEEDKLEAENSTMATNFSEDEVHVPPQEDMIEKLHNPLTCQTANNETTLEISEMSKVPARQDFTDYLHRELNFLKAKSESLNNGIRELKSELINFKQMDERVLILEREKTLLKSSIEEIESKHFVSEEYVSVLKVEFQNIQGKIANLQKFLDKATKQADYAVMLLQQHQELQKQVGKLEACLDEANVYKLSSQKLQQFNENMERKMKILEERLKRSDDVIYSCVQLYQESVKEFQDTLDSVKEENKRRALHQPVDDMPWEFWSNLLLLIDRWLLEKKIRENDAKRLREMVQNRDARIRDAYTICSDKEQQTIVSFQKLASSIKRSELYVVHVAAEMAPVAKVGGLGDVVTGLTKALQKKGHLVEIILPKYDCMHYDSIHGLKVVDTEIESYFDGRLYKNKIWVGIVEGLPVYFVEPLHPARFFRRGQFYGEHDDFKRFSYFSRAAVELLHAAGKKPDIIHCHDWQTAFVAPLYWDLYAPKGWNSARICFTCHNFEYQGTVPVSELSSCGLDAHQLNRPDRMQDNSAHDRINIVKGGIVFSNIVTTVSPTYAQEVRTAQGGRGLQATLNACSKKFIGILNGIDIDAWNPATDSFLEVHYDAHDLRGKTVNKRTLCKKLGLASLDDKQPLVGCITRLVPQKGVHLIRHAIYRTLDLGGQFVLLGSSPVPHIQKEFEGIARQFEGHDRIRLILKYDESLSHSIYAASDMFIIPSVFEPCGLTQMIAMRYGSLPIVRKTGGLNDSVFDLDEETVPAQFRNGFTFLNPDEQGVKNALERAFSHYRKDRKQWVELVRKVMNIDFSWDSSAAQYEELYEMAAARARAASRS